MEELVKVLAAAVVGYLLGSISFARLIAARTAPGVDITRTEIEAPRTKERWEIRGAQASSLMGRASGPWRLAAVVLDMAKAFVPTLAFRLAFPDSSAFVAAYAGAVIGHNWPIWHGFLGGFGISSIMGGALAIDPVGLLVTMPLGIVVGRLLWDEMSMINGFAVLLPAWYFIVRGDIPATVGGLVVLVAYWVAKSQRLVHAKGEGVQAAPGPAAGDS